MVGVEEEGNAESMEFLSLLPSKDSTECSAPPAKKKGAFIPMEVSTLGTEALSSLRLCRGGGGGMERY